MINFSALDAATQPQIEQDFTGQWRAVSYKPDLVSPQSFVVGIALQADDGSSQIRMLRDVRKFRCIYGNRLKLDHIEWSLEELDSHLQLLSSRPLPLADWNSPSPNFVLGPPRYAAGRNAAAVMSELFEAAVAMAEKPSNDIEFQTITTPGVRLQVANELRKIASLEYENIAYENGVTVKVKNGSVTYDVNYMREGRAASVISGWTRTPDTLRRTMWHAGAELSHFTSPRGIKPAIFLLFPDSSKGIPREDWGAMQKFLSEEALKLDDHGFDVVTQASSSDLAVDLWSWLHD